MDRLWSLDPSLPADVPRVYGAGLPRTGTKALARCLNLVRPTHHECAAHALNSHSPSTDGRAFFLGLQQDASPYYGHENEVAFYFTFMLPYLPDGKRILLWRPWESWYKAAWGFGLMDEKQPHMLMDNDAAWVDLSVPREERLFIMYEKFSTALLEHSRREDAYLTRIDSVDFSGLFAWLGWDHTAEQLRWVNALREAKPHRGKYDPASISVPFDAPHVCLELEAVTR